MVTIPSGQNIRRDFSHSIPINDDSINEEMEAFLILVETSEATAVSSEAPPIIYERNGLAIGIINDDDGQFSTSMCMAQSYHKRQQEYMYKFEGLRARVVIHHPITGQGSNAKRFTLMYPIFVIVLFGPWPFTFLKRMAQCRVLDYMRGYVIS